LAFPEFSASLRDDLRLQVAQASISRQVMYSLRKTNPNTKC
jgi:hypothetical protein